jgi:hypothetical protein
MARPPTKQLRICTTALDKWRQFEYHLLNRRLLRNLFIRHGGRRWITRFQGVGVIRRFDIWIYHAGMLCENGEEPGYVRASGRFRAVDANE